MCACVNVCVRARMYACICVYARVRVCAYVRACLRAHVCACMCALVCMCVYIYIYIHTHTHTHILFSFFCSTVFILSPVTIFRFLGIALSGGKVIGLCHIGYGKVGRHDYM